MEQHKLSTTFPSFATGVFNSYTQIFFSNNRIFAGILFVVSFFDFWAGFSGLTATVTANFMAYLMGLNQSHIKKGYYGFNSLLVGLGLGLHYQPGPAFYIVLIFASLLTLFLTLWFEGVIGKYGLPFMSISFLFGIWLVTLAARQFTTLQISERGIFMTNEMFSLGGHPMVESYNWFKNLGLPVSLKLYFTSLGAIFFQYHLFAGILIAAGLIIYSRISFVLSLLGFFSAYFYYQIVGANLQDLGYSFIGFNYILTAIAIGGFFIVPSRWSFLWVILLTPVISIILTSTQAVFNLMQLSVFSLPFNMVVLLFLYSLKFRDRYFTKPELVAYQQYSPERNLYAHLNYKARFGRSRYYPITLPFWGTWKVTQGHLGDFTHQGDWKHAWDFEVTDEEGLTYTGEGHYPDDYFAFSKPVVAPADGHVEEVVDGVEENIIGNVDLEHNWGNTIILKHADQLYTKLSHLKNGSIKVSVGDAVVKGQALAQCGNSGRSPYPHLHFQVQGTPYIGSKTLDFPVSHYIRLVNGTFELKSYEIPGKGDLISNITRNHALEKAFHFIPGQEFRLKVRNDRDESCEVRWEVQVDAVNSTCIYCEKTRSRAWFYNDGDIHYFTHFEGDKSSLLFKFYLAAYKVMMGYYQNMTVTDYLPVNTFNKLLVGWLQDFTAPFWLFTRNHFSLHYLAMEDELMQSNIRLRSKTSALLARRVLRNLECDLFIGSRGLERFILEENGFKTEVILVNER